MSERIPDARWSEAEQALLTAARGERMPAELEARMRDALDFQKPALDVDAAASSSLHDSVSVRPLFAGKLPLWGTLSVLVLGTIGYYALRVATSQPSAAATAAQHAAGERGAPARQSAADDKLATSAQPARVANGQGAGAWRAGAADPARQAGPEESAARHGATEKLRQTEAMSSMLPTAESEAQHAASRRAAAGEERANAHGVVTAGELTVRRDAPRSERAVRGDRPVAFGQQGAHASRSTRAQGASEQRAALGDPGGLASATRPEGASEQRAVAGPGDAKTRRSAVVRAAPNKALPLPPLAADELAAAGVEASGDRAALLPDELRIEAQWLEQARRALARSALPEARQWLTRYRARFAHGALQPESQVLEIELKVRTGARTSAQHDADKFLAQHPQHPLRERVERLTQALE